MYLRDQLERFAEQIPDQNQAQTFRDVLDTIHFDADGLCPGGALDIFGGTAVDALRLEFEQRHFEFLRQEDFEWLSDDDQ